MCAMRQISKVLGPDFDGLNARGEIYTVENILETILELLGV